MRKGMPILVVLCLVSGFVGGLSGGGERKPDVSKTPDHDVIARLETRIGELERRLELLEKLSGDDTPDEEWKNRTLGSGMVNGSRVYVLPLSHVQRIRADK